MYIETAAAGLVVGLASGYGLSRIGIRDRYKYIKLEAKARASAIRQEAEVYLQKAKSKAKSVEQIHKDAYHKMLESTKEQNAKLSTQIEESKKEKIKIARELKKLGEQSKRLDALELEKQEIINEATHKLVNVASLTKREAREFILKSAKESSRADIAALTRKQLQTAKENAQRDANYVLAQATTRYAGDFAGERLTNMVNLVSDDHKGRIIGKEGRNIKALEQILGVDIIIDETPNVIIVSSFNLYRRAIATRVIEILIDDGRIHPGRIEEAYEKVQKEYESKIYDEGERVVLDLGLFPMDKELISLIGRLKYRASYGQNALAHSLEVAGLARIMAAEMGGDEKIATRAGLLHDIGKALTQDFGGSHVELGAEVCKRHNEDPIVINAIFAHHGYEEVESVECAAVCAADTLSAARPGARREMLESFTMRVSDIEKLAMENSGVMHAYAINAGREIRVFVDANRLDDNEATLLSSTLAKKIEDRVQYPGEIKVNVIRETRSVTFAK